MFCCSCWLGLLWRPTWCWLLGLGPIRLRCWWRPHVAWRGSGRKHFLSAGQLLVDRYSGLVKLAEQVLVGVNGPRGVPGTPNRLEHLHMHMLVYLSRFCFHCHRRQHSLVFGVCGRCKLCVSIKFLLYVFINICVGYNCFITVSYIRISYWFHCLT